MLQKNIKHQVFREINLNDPFFDTLKADYPEFPAWFIKHAEREAYVFYDENNRIQGFLHLKVEENLVDDVRPIILSTKILKVATFKVNAHGTKLGERFIKIITDRAIEENADVCYVTIFPKHESLISLVNRFGFEYHGKKNEENVYVKNMKRLSGDIEKDYPLVCTKGYKKYLLGIYPKYHSVMFPDSILKTENRNLLADISHTNSIHKVYVCSMKVEILKKGDIIVLYRTTEEGKKAEYSAMVTSICVVEEVKRQDEFSSFENFYWYASRYSVFDKEDLQRWYKQGKCQAIKMTYNIAMKKRIIRHELINQVGLERNQYWGFFELSDTQFYNICRLSEINPAYINPAYIKR